MFNVENCLFLFIDIQEKLLQAAFNKDMLEKKCKILAKVREILDIPLVVTEQYPKGLGSTIEGLANGAVILEKTAFNAIKESDIELNISKTNKTQIVVCGIETHICVYQTVMALQKKGYDVTVVIDACGSRFESEYILAIDIMRQAGVKIKTAEMVIFELLGDAKHPSFKEIQTLIK